MPAPAAGGSFAILRRIPSRGIEESAIIADPNLASGGLSAQLLQHRAALLRFLLARQVAPEEAEDILQDLFVKLEERTLGPVPEPRAYLYRATENLLLDRRRGQRRRAKRDELWTGAQSGATLETCERPSAEQILIARERLTSISDALARLPERTLLIFRSFRLDGLSQKEIALQLGISVSAVEKHLQRAYRALVDARAQLDADAPPPRRP